MLTTFRDFQPTPDRAITETAALPLVHQPSIARLRSLNRQADFFTEGMKLASEVEAIDNAIQRDRNADTNMKRLSFALRSLSSMMIATMGMVSTGTHE